jgi:hypothetical protein
VCCDGECRSQLVSTEKDGEGQAGLEDRGMGTVVVVGSVT